MGVHVLIMSTTGGSAQAAGTLVQKLGGVLLGHVFILELDFLKGRDKLAAPAYTLLTSQETSLDSSRARETSSEVLSVGHLSP